MRPPPPSLVVFDLGGVLVRIARSWDEACAAAGVPRRPGADVTSARLARDPWVVAYETGAVTREAFLSGVAASTGGLYGPEEVARVHDAWLIAEYPGLPALFDALDAAGLPTAVLSNTNEAHWAAMYPSAGASPRFPTLARVRHPHASHRLGVRKPDAAAFRAVEATAGTAGAGVWFFDDLAPNVDAARAHGWTAVLVDPSDPVTAMRAALAAALG